MAVGKVRPSISVPCTLFDISAISSQVGHQFADLESSRRCETVTD
jgi:hypothetical protein